MITNTQFGCLKQPISFNAPKYFKSGPLNNNFKSTYENYSRYFSTNAFTSTKNFLSVQMTTFNSSMKLYQQFRGYHTSLNVQAKDDVDKKFIDPIDTEYDGKAGTLTNNRLQNRAYYLIYHKLPLDYSDYIAYYFIKFLRVFADTFFAKRYGHRAIVLETVAAVPGMIAGILRHFRSLRLMRHDGGWIKELLDEADNERMHLLTFIKLFKPTLFERIIVLGVQLGFSAVWFVLYLVFPRVCHRMAGYLEEEAVFSYTQFLEQIDSGHIENVAAPELAIKYWKLSENAKLRDVVLAVRTDEAHHRDVNHRLADAIIEGQPPDLDHMIGHVDEKKT